MERVILFFSDQFERATSTLFESGKSIVIPGITFEAGIGMLFSCRGCDPNLLYAKMGTQEDLSSEELDWMKISDYKNEQGEKKQIAGAGAVYLEKLIYQEIVENPKGQLKLDVFFKGEHEIEFMARIVSL